LLQNIRWMNVTSFICLMISILPTCASSQAQVTPLRSAINEIAKSIEADIGVAIVDLQSNDTLSINGQTRFPMQSVFKFHVALAVLKLVDEGKLSLDTRYRVTSDHYFKTWSVLMRAHPNADVDVTLQDLIVWTVMNSDNVACDMLFDITGGPAKVETFIKSLGINDVGIASTEREMHQSWDIPFRNWSTPKATAALLSMFNDGKILSEQSTALLSNAMRDTPNAPKRLKGMLPEGTTVIRKPGTGASNAEGVIGAVNDVGILLLPNGKKVIVVAYVTRTSEKFEDVENVIARISRAVYDHYTK
jgi:beta-lactamase class A